VKSGNNTESTTWKKNSHWGQVRGREAKNGASNWGKVGRQIRFIDEGIERQRKRILEFKGTPD